MDVNSLCLLRGGEKKQAEQTDEIPCHWIWFLINIVRRASSNYGYGNPKQSLKYAYIFKHRGAVECYQQIFSGHFKA